MVFCDQGELHIGAILNKIRDLREGGVSCVPIKKYITSIAHINKSVYSSTELGKDNFSMVRRFWVGNDILFRVGGKKHWPVWCCSPSQELSL